MVPAALSRRIAPHGLVGRRVVDVEREAGLLGVEGEGSVDVAMGTIRTSMLAFVAAAFLDGSGLTHISRTGAPALTAGGSVARGKTTVCRATNAHDRSRPDEWSAERTMGLSWQQGPLGRNPNGQFLVPAMPERVLYAEPLRRRLA